MNMYIAFKNITTHHIRIACVKVKCLVDAYHYADANKRPDERVYGIH